MLKIVNQMPIFFKFITDCINIPEEETILNIADVTNKFAAEKTLQFNILTT